MYYWLFNQKRLDISGSQKESVSWDQGRRFNGREGDHVIFFRLAEDGRFFTYLYTINSIDQSAITVNKGGENRLKIELTLQLETKFDEKEIDNYIYSIPRIKSYDKHLIRHFRNKYYRLSSTEYNAIIKDRIFTARTYLGAALNAMHIDHRKAFSQLLLERYPKALMNIYNHDAVFSLFREYFNYAVVVPAQQLEAANANMQDVLGEEQSNRISFSDGDTNIADRVSVQTSRIQDFLDSYNQLIQEYQSDNLNKTFDKIFKNKPLPIDLNE